MTPTFFNPTDPEDYVKAIGSKLPLKIWIKIETGLARLGIAPEEVYGIIERIKTHTQFSTEGLYTHLGSQAGAKDKATSDAQWKIFKGVIDDLQALGVNIPYVQLSNSAAVIDLPHTWLNSVSIGHGLYGILETEDPKYELNLKNVFRALKSRLISIKHYPAGFKVAGVELNRDSVIGIVPIGCGDGFSSKNVGGDVLVMGKRARIMNKISLEHMRIDVTDIPNVRVGDEVTIYGAQGNDEITFKEICKRLQVSILEILTSIHHSSVTYLYIKNGKVLQLQ